ncbi:MAG TPA: hypothetical protein VGD16_09220, partial [Enterovirga sp.]
INKTIDEAAVLAALVARRMRHEHDGEALLRVGRRFLLERGLRHDLFDTFRQVWPTRLQFR